MFASSSVTFLIVQCSSLALFTTFCLQNNMFLMSSKAVSGFMLAEIHWKRSKYHTNNYIFRCILVMDFL